MRLLRQLLSRSRSHAFTLLELLVVIVILAVLLAVAIPEFLSQPLKAKDAKAKSYLTLAWQDLVTNTTSNEANFGTASELAGELRYDEPQLKFQQVNDCSTSTMAGFDSKTVVVVGPQTNAKAVVLCIRSDSGTIWELIASASGADPTIVDTSTLTSKQPVNVASPAITGDVRTGQTLTVAEGGWESDTPPTYSYQWQKCDSSGNNCVNISGATSSTYLVGSGDVGSTFKVQVTATNASGSSTAVTAPTGAANTSLAGLPVNTAIPQVAGAPAEGQTVTGVKGTWTGKAPITYSYQWLQSTDGGSTWTPINGATSLSYTIPASEVGNDLELEVTAANSSGEQDSTSAPLGPVYPPPVNTAAPAVSGTPQDQQTLTVSNGSWQYGPTTYSYQWQYSSNGGSTWANISGATTSSYTVPYSTYDGDKLRAQVTATNPAGSTLASSAATAVVVPVAPMNTGAPSVSGTDQVGQTLTAARGSWTGTPTISYSYQWQTSTNGTSGWTPISGATSSTYSLQGTDAGNYLRVEVTAANSAGSSFADSVATAQVLSAIPAGTVVPYAGKTPLPTGWVISDGSCGYSSSSSPDLYSAIGTTYGGTSSNFCLPDMRGRFALGKAASGTGSALGATGGALDQAGTVYPWGTISESYSWGETPPAPAAIPHSHSDTDPFHSNYWINNWYTFVNQAVTLNTNNETFSTLTTNVSASGSATPSASYSVSNPPYVVVRYLISVSRTAAPPCGALWGYGGSSAPSGSQLANGGSPSGSLTSCLDPSFGSALPDLRGRAPVGQTSSGSAASLAASGGSINQNVSSSLNTGSTQATVTPPAWGATLVEGTHSHSISYSTTTLTTNGGSIQFAAAATPPVGNNSNAGSTYGSSSYSPGSLAATGSGAQTPTSSTFNTSFKTLNWVAYTSTSYAPAVGTITPYAGSSAPTHWLLADGSCYSTSSYAGLFAAFGYTYGGSGSTFCVPDLRGRFPLGVATSGTGSSLGAAGGTLSPAPTLSFSGWTPSITIPTHGFSWSVPAHTHTIGPWAGGQYGQDCNCGNGALNARGPEQRTSGAAGGGSVSSTVSAYAVNASAVGNANASPPVSPPPFTALNMIVYSG